MITIIYDPNDTKNTHSDGIVMKFANEMENGKTYITSTENLIFAARIILIQRGLEHRFYYNGEYIYPNEYGAIHKWPKGFCNTGYHLNAKIIRFGREKREKELNSPE